MAGTHWAHTGYKPLIISGRKTAQLKFTHSLAIIQNCIWMNINHIVFNTNVFLFRIGESLSGNQGKDHVEESDSEDGAHSSPDPHRQDRGTGATPALTESQGPAGTSERPVRTSSGLRRGENNPERYLHRILHWLDPNLWDEDFWAVRLRVYQLFSLPAHLSWTLSSCFRD